MINNQCIEKDRPLQKFIDEEIKKYKVKCDYNQRIYREGFNWLIDIKNKWYILGNEATVALVTKYIENIWSDKELVSETNIHNIDVPEGYGILLAESVEIEKWCDSLNEKGLVEYHILGYEMEMVIKEYVDNM